MAYNWEWACKSGEFTFKGYKYNFYQGNGFMIILDEFIMTESRKDIDTADEDVGKECYRVAWFFVDKDHAKRCLGLTKGSYDMFEGLVEKITIYKDHCSNWKDIVDLFTKSQPNIVIEIRPTEPKAEKPKKKKSKT